MRSLIIAFTAFAATAAAAQDSNFGAVKRVPAPEWRDSSLEVKPASLITSAVPNLGAFAIGGEKFVDDHAAAFVNLSFMTADLNKKTAADNDDKFALPDRVNSYGADLGGRYYGTPAGHSWYAGAKLGYSRSEGTWTYQDESLRKEVASLTPGAEGGYRWLFQNGLLVRTGLGVGGNVVVGEKTDEDASDKAVEAVNKATKPAVSGKVDLGLGYAF